MTTFQDKFDRAHALELNNSNGWFTIGDDDQTTGVIHHYAGTAANEDGAESAAAFQTGTLPTTGEQEISAWMTATVEHPSSTISIGIGGLLGNTPAWADIHHGVYAQMDWESGGQRTIKLKQEIRDGLDETASLVETVTLATLELVADGGTPATGIRGGMLEDGAVGILQHVRLIVRATEYGLQVCGYVNNSDDDRPTVQALLRSDLDSPTGTSFGQWWFQFGANGEANSQQIAEFSGRDYTLVGVGERAVLKREDHATIHDLTERVKRKLSGGSVELTDFELREYIADTIENVMNELQGAPWFLLRQAEYSLTTDSEGYATLAADIERPLNIERKGQRRPAHWAFSHYDDSGDCVVRLDFHHESSSATYLIQYLARWQRADHPTDLCVIPKRHTTAVVYGVCREIAATRERSTAMTTNFDALYKAALVALKRDQAKQSQQRMLRLRPRRRAVAQPFHSPSPRY